jgi:type VI secretion system secreted protein VgrG
MPEYSQAGRPLRVDTPLPTDTLLLNGFNGIEALSQPFTFQLDLLSPKHDIDPADLVGNPMLTSFQLPDGSQRLIHGLVSRLAYLGKQDELSFYRAEIVPWLWRLTLTRESRMYQDLTVPQILEQVFERTGNQDFELRLTRQYAPREYCVQYRETHFNFVSRLMEEEGIFYFFEHLEDSHILVLCDDNESTIAASAAETVRFLPEHAQVEDAIHELEGEFSLQTSKITIWNYDYLQPTLKLRASLGDEFESYDYPAHYRDPEQGDAMARLLLEAEEAARQIVRGTSTVRGLMPGRFFTLAEHFRSDANTKYLLTQVQHYARAGGYRAWDDQAAFDYRNDFQAIPFATPYRPQRRTPRPTIRGWQPAIVTGPAGEEVHIDKYGRVKVQFYWDRDGRRDEKTSCWIRVTTPWGGKGYGSVSIPRIGNEVAVAFQEGDPDMPLIIGSVFNADQMPPFELPGAGIQMGMKSRSSPGGGGMNEITMTDTKGKEMMNVHAQYDLVTTVQHDEKHTVKSGNRTISVETGTHTETIKGNTSITISSGTYKLDVAANTYTHHVKGDVTETYDAKQNTTVTGDVTETYKANHKSTCSHNITIDGGDKITLVSGASQITLEKSGKITIKATNIDIIADATLKISGDKVEVTGGSEAKLGVSNQQVTCDKTKVNTSGAAINSSAVGMHEITGALVKIN